MQVVKKKKKIAAYYFPPTTATSLSFVPLIFANTQLDRQLVLLSAGLQDLYRFGESWRIRENTSVFSSPRLQLLCEKDFLVTYYTASDVLLKFREECEKKKKKGVAFDLAVVP